MPNLGGGLGGSVGIAAESTYGTWVAPTRWIEVRNAKMQERVHVEQGTGLAAGRSVDLGSRRKTTYKDAGGSISMEVLNSSFGLLLNNIMGSNGNPTQIGTTSAYKLTANYGVPDNQNYLSMQALVPNTAGTLFQQNFHGCKIQKATFTIDMSSPLMLDLEIDSQQVTTSEGAGTPSYTAATRNFTFVGMSFKVGGYQSEATIDGVRKMTVTIERTLRTDRIYMGNSTKFEPITAGVTKISGSADVDLTASNKSVLWDLYDSQAAIPSIVMQFTGNAITGGAGNVDTLTLNPTNVYIDSGGTPELDGPDIVSTTLNWSGLIDTANDNPFQASLISADTTL